MGTAQGKSCSYFLGKTCWPLSCTKQEHHNCDRVFILLCVSKEGRRGPGENLLSSRLSSIGSIFRRSQENLNCSVKFWNPCGKLILHRPSSLAWLNLSLPCFVMPLLQWCSLLLWLNRRRNTLFCSPTNVVQAVCYILCSAEAHISTLSPLIWEHLLHFCLSPPSSDSINSLISEFPCWRGLCLSFCLLWLPASWNFPCLWLEDLHRGVWNSLYNIQR